MLVRNFGAELGLPWTSAFDTKQRSEVEDYCRRSAIHFEWTRENQLRTKQVRNAVSQHPQTGELVWFNHAAFFHVSTLDPTIREALLQEFEQQDLPSNTYYGDGSQISDSSVDAIRDAYSKEMIFFDWQKGDVLILDNMLMAHSRMSYTGNRRILFAMAEPTSHDDVSIRRDASIAKTP